jgi:hypothetical protein
MANDRDDPVALSVRVYKCATFNAALAARRARNGDLEPIDFAETYTNSPSVGNPVRVGKNANRPMVTKRFSYSAYRGSK